MSESEVPDCPLCMEAFEIDDINFYPCTCGYQVCRFCWHRIRTDENGLCPACRKTYSEDPAMYQPLSQDELHKIKKERKQQEVQQKQKASDNRQHLSNIRVIQKHLVFVVGLSNKMADPEVLKKQEYFGKYGKISKIVINPNTNYAGPQGPSASAYITYAKEEEALHTILAINNMQPPLKIRASLGTTKYCTHYLRNTICPKQDCMYLHDVGDMNASFTKEDMQAGKHQIFEKDLLDNQMLSVQKQRHAHCPNHNSANHQEISEDSSETAWGDDSTVLPSNASWAAISDEKEKKPDQKSRSNSVTSTDYPNLEASNKVLVPPVLVCSEGNGQVETTEVVTNQPDVTAVTDHIQESSSSTDWKTEKQTEEKKKQKVVDLVEPSPPPPVSVPPHINEVTSTTTTTSTTTVTVASTTSSYQWPCMSDLGLSDLTILTSDDELGFDPFKESKTGLEDLIASERKQGLTKSEQTPKPSFSWDSFWPTATANYRNNVPPPMMANSSYSLFGSVQAMSQNQMRPNAPVNPYNIPNPNSTPTTLHQNNPSLVQNPNMSFPFRFTNPQQQQPSPQHPMAGQFLHQSPNRIAAGQQPPPPPAPGNFGSRFPFMQSPINSLHQQQHPTIVSLNTSTSTTSSTVTSTNSSSSSTDKNWQDGLRALLPNINISFATNWKEMDNLNSLLSPSEKVTTPQEEQEIEIKLQQTQPEVAVKPTTPQQPHSSSLISSVASPPPGFSLLTNYENKVKEPWPEKEEQQQQQQQQQPRIPAPPPGFHATAEHFTSPNTPTSSVETIPTSVDTKGLLGMVSPSETELTPIPTNTTAQLSKRNSQILGDDPSVLWSKVLSDKAKREIETTAMLFPLPGETVDQALNSANLPSTPPQSIPQNPHMMSWNSVVSGNQFGKSPTSRDFMEPCTVNINNPSSEKDFKEAASSKPQKPSPIFGNQQKHAVKKPTAHVKPLKCSPPTDGFTMVHNSSSSTSSRQQPTAVNGHVNMGSRVSELDDFSTDLPIPGNVNVTANVVSSFIDYPSVAQAASSNALGKAGGKKKKKNKGKEQVAVVAVEVVVGFATNNTQQDKRIEEERPKKGKNKKKNNKTSPPSQRKNNEPSAIDKADLQQTIRILKSDASSTHSQSQAVAGSSNASPTHDHEIVSRLTESTEKLLKNVLFETEAIKLNTEQISKDLKSALEKCKESSLSLSDLEKINLLLTPGKITNSELDDSDLVDTSDLERQVESARREAKMLEARLNDVIRKNMASELETLKRNTKSS